MKRCSKCERLLSIKQFSKNRRTKDGLRVQCKACNAVYDAAYRQTPKGKAVNRATVIRYQQTPKGKAATVRYRQTPNGHAKASAAGVRYRIKHPLKAWCRRQLNHAITAGKIKRQPCMNGCKAKAEAHHSDYSKPFDVLWLCRKCHRAWHAANK